MASASNPEVLQSTLEENVCMGGVPPKDPLYSNCPRQEISEDDKPDSPTEVESSSARSFERVPETCANDPADLSKSTRDESVNTAIKEKLLLIKETLSKETSSKKGSDSTEKIIEFPVKCSNCKPFPEETGSNGKNYLSHSNEIASIGNIQANLDNSESRDVKKASCSKSDTGMRYSFGGKLNASDTDGILNRKSLESPLNFPNFEIDVSQFTAENFKIPVFDRDDEKFIEEGLRHFVSVNPVEIFDSHATTSTCIPRASNDPIFDLFPSSAEELKPSALFGRTSNKSLSEMLSILENWSRRGLDKAFNGPVKVTSADIGVNLEKDLQYGPVVMREMTKRIYTLIRAANTLPDPDTILLRAFDRGRTDVLGDLIRAAFTIWRTIDGMEIQLSLDCRKLKLLCGNDSEKSTEAVNYIEQEENPNILITNAYTLVTEQLPLLRIQMKDFLEKIRAFCTEIDELL